MYKVIIIDDERIARETVCAFIEKRTDEFEVCECFADGESAFSYMEKNKVDVVITDIKMPKMTGLDLIKKINKIDPDCHIIIISGYGKFEYAKEAIRYNVENYILKPVDIDELLETLEEIKRKLVLRKSNETKSSDDFDIKEEFFIDLLKGGLTDPDFIREKWNKANFPVTLEKSFGCIFVVEILNFDEYIIKNWTYGKEGVYTALLNIFKSELKLQNVYAVKNSDSEFFFICLSEPKNINIGNAEIEKAFSDILGIIVKVRKKEFFDNISELFSVTECYVSMDDIVSLLLVHLINGEKNEAVAIFNRYSEIDDGYYNHIMKKLYSHLKALKIYFIRRDNFSDFGECVDYLIYNIKANNTKNDFIIESAKNFIEKNYQNDISREDVANNVFLNSAYFSKYFKKKTGETFYNYLLKVRMTKAMEFLKIGKSATDCCTLVGYSNLGYFNKKFKQFTGYTPGEYKRLTNAEKQ